MDVASRSRAFLVEFIIVILFFSIATGIIVRVFAGANSIRQKANDLTIAAAKVQSIAEYAKASEGKKDYIEQLEKQGAIEEQEETYVYYYDKEWALQKGSQNYNYKIEVQCESQSLKAGEVLKVQISANKAKLQMGNTSLSEIYALQSIKYYPKTNN